MKHPTDHGAWSRLPPCRESILTGQDVELIADPRLIANFSSGFLHATFSGGLWRGSLQLISDTRIGAYVEALIAIARELLAIDGYNNDSRALIFTFGQDDVVIDDEDIDEALQSAELFQRLVNLSWTQLWHSFPVYQLVNLGFVVDPNAPTTRQLRSFEPMWAGARDKQYLIETVQAYRYLLLHHAVGISATGMPTLVKTSGSGGFTNDPELGRVPAGLSYIDLSEWDGENREYSEADLRRIGPSKLQQRRHDDRDRHITHARSTSMSAPRRPNASGKNEKTLCRGRNRTSHTPNAFFVDFATFDPCRQFYDGPNIPDPFGIPQIVLLDVDGEPVVMLEQGGDSGLVGQTFYKPAGYSGQEGFGFIFDRTYTSISLSMRVKNQDEADRTLEILTFENVDVFETAEGGELFKIDVTREEQTVVLQADATKPGPLKIGAFWVYTDRHIVALHTMTGV